MPLRRSAAAIKAKIEEGQQEQLQQGLDGTRVRNQLPGKALPPGGPTGSGYPPAPHDTAWTDVTGTPTTLAGYGITDAASDTDLATEASTRGAADTALAAPQYLVLALSGTLGNERRLVAGTGISITDGGANGDATIAASGLTNPMTTQDDIIIGAASGTPDRLAKGSDGQVLTVDPTTHHLVWATPTGGSSLTVEEVDGSPTDSAVTKIVFPNGTLAIVAHVATYTPSGTSADAVGTGTSAVTIGGLAGSPDVNGVGGAGLSFEFEAGDAAPTWSTSPAASDVGTTIASHLYIQTTSGSEILGLYAWSPGSGAFDARMGKVSMGNGAAGDTSAFGLIITDSGNSNRVLLEMETDPTNRFFHVDAYTYAGGYTGRGGSWRCVNGVYMRITRDGSNNISFWYSDTGLVWQLIATQSFTFTVANIGVRVGAVSTGGYGAIDSLRTSV